MNTSNTRDSKNRQHQQSKKVGGVRQGVISKEQAQRRFWPGSWLLALGFWMTSLFKKEKKHWAFSVSSKDAYEYSVINILGRNKGYHITTTTTHPYILSNPQILKSSHPLILFLSSSHPLKFSFFSSTHYFPPARISMIPFRYNTLSLLVTKDPCRDNISISRLALASESAFPTEISWPYMLICPKTKTLASQLPLPQQVSRSGISLSSFSSQSPSSTTVKTAAAQISRPQD